MDPWDDDGPLSQPQSRDLNLHYLLSSSRQSAPSTSEQEQEQQQKPSRRVVYPAVPFMTVKAERKCLSEIRNHGGPVAENFLLSNGMKAEDFALMYVLGHQLKRKEKQSSVL